jgi:catechol 2,3-dioxygenase-like lactoylglutathione lyase family enzyme
MQATRIFANLRVADIEAAKRFYTDYLGLSNEEFNMGWVARYASADAKAKVQLVTSDATAPEDSVISVCTDDIDSAYAEAPGTGLRDRPSTKHRGMGPAAILCAGTRRQSDQHRGPPGLTFTRRAGSPAKLRRPLTPGRRGTSVWHLAAVSSGAHFECFGHMCKGVLSVHVRETEFHETANGWWGCCSSDSCDACGGS